MRITERRKPDALLGALTTTLLVAGSIMVAPSIASAEPVAADTGVVEEATLDWGVRESFRNYIVGPIPKGKIDLLGNTTGQYLWSGGQGTAALDGSAASVSYGEGNGVHFRGHQSGPAEDETYILDIAFTNPRVVVVSPTVGELRVDVEGREYVNTTTVGERFSTQDALLAELTLPEPTVDGDVWTWNNAGAVLAEEGVSAFAGFYPAGEPLDPVTFSFPVAPAQVTVETQTSLESSLSEGVQGDAVTLTATVSPEAPGTVQFAANGDDLAEPQPVASGVATLETSALAAGVNSVTAEFLPAEGAGFLGSVSDAVEITMSSRPVPTVMIDKLSGFDPAGETVTVRGTGFLPDPPATNGQYIPLEGRFTGTYVAFGSFAENWRPSEGAGSAARKTLDTRWAVQAAELDLISSVPGGIELGADGSFETTLTLTKDSAEALVDGLYGIYTYAGGGARYAPFETYTPISFAPGQATSTTLEVSETWVFVGDAVELSATVTAEVPGTVQFNAGDEKLGEPIEVAEGFASLLTTELELGQNRVTAEFLPANTDTHVSSLSAEIPVTVAALPVALINGEPAGSVAVNPGDELELKIGAFAAGDEFEVEVLSEDAVNLGLHGSDSEGFVNVDWTVPTDFELGTHALVVTNTDTAREFTFADAFLVEKAETDESGGGGNEGGNGPGGTGPDGSAPGGSDDTSGGKTSADALSNTGADGLGLTLAVGGGLLLLLGGALLVARRGTRMASITSSTE